MGGKISLASFAGLVTAPGRKVRNEASCTQADNVLFEAPGVIRKRTGFARQPGGTGGPLWQVLSSRLMGDNVLAHYGTSTGGTGLKYGDGSTTLANITALGGAITRSPSNRMHGAVCQRNHYVTGDEGVRRIESDMTTARFAGMPHGAVFTAGLAAGTSIAVGYGRAYRLTWHRKDNDGVVLGGPPTMRTVAYNMTGMLNYTGAARGVAVQIPLPQEWGTASTAITTTYFYRLWASRSQALSASDPDDELFLIAEAYPTSAEITAGLVAITDDTPDTYLQAQPKLNTNATNLPPDPNEVGKLPGILNADNQPPACNDLAYWQDVMWFANCTWLPSASFNLIAAMSDGDTVSVGGRTYRAKNAPIAYGDFQIYSGFASLAMNLQKTAEALAHVINLDALGSTVHAFVRPAALGFPEVYVEGRTQTSTFAVSVSANTWRGVTTTSPLGSTSSVQPNQLVYSKPFRADAVPPINTISVGPTDSRILRLAAFRDRLIVFTDYGVYQVTGRSCFDFSVAPFDTSFRLRAPECVALCDDRVYAWCFEGIIEIDYGGINVVSPAIENVLEAIVSTCGSTSLAQAGFAVAYRQHHRVAFWYPSAAVGASRQGCGSWIGYDTRTKAWFTGSIARGSSVIQNTCGVVRLSDDRLLLGDWNNASTDSYLFLERTRDDATPYVDTIRTGSGVNVESSISFVRQQPDDAGAASWQQVLVDFETQEGAGPSWVAAPTALNVGFITEWGSSVDTIANSTSDKAIRIEVPMACRRAPSLALTVSHTTAEYLGLVGVTAQVASVSGFSRRTS